ncbi:MAG TPA: hypothetical protein PL151_20905 [Phycisphaerae bacterium]|nr:hypothetical protein [Phycisphaerae bacterium]
MAIHYTCRCGANIRMPHNVAGRKARCNSCGYIFTVPSPELNPEPPASTRKPAARSTPPASASESPRVELPTESSGEVGDWLGEFVRHEQAAESLAPPSVENDRSTVQPPPLLEFADDEDDIVAPPAKTPRRVRLASDPDPQDDARSGVLAPTRSYWADLAASFFFFLDSGSLITFVIIIVINLWALLVSHAPFIGAIGTLIISGYLCTFYLSVIKETAAGEDELPNIWIDDVVNDLILSSFRFLGTWAWVLLPAMAVALIEYINVGQVHWKVVGALAVIGLFFWPVVILGLAIGGGFSGLWPHTIVMTALVAPLPYLAMCVVLLVAASITFISRTPMYAALVSKLINPTSSNFGLFWVLAVINATLSVYATILAMRTIGLYYRHYKRKFPWVAE